MSDNPLKVGGDRHSVLADYESLVLSTPPRPEEILGNPDTAGVCGSDEISLVLGERGEKILMQISVFLGY